MSKYNKEFKLNEDKTKICLENDQWLDLGTRNPYKHLVTFLVLDFNKANETYTLLRSIREKVKFPNYEIVLLSNGGNQEHIVKLYAHNLIDKVIMYKENVGCGIATHDLFDNVRTEYAIYVQNDHMLLRDFTIEEFNQLVFNLNNGFTSIDLSGGAGHNDKFSERAYIVKTDTFKNLTIKAYGGPGPYETWLWSEAGTSYSYWSEGLNIHHNWPVLFGNTGFRTIREDSNGIIIERYYL
jgi:hypothetical protein